MTTRSLQRLTTAPARFAPPARRSIDRPAERLGNQARLRRLATGAPALQAKLTVGAVDDPLEHEADAAADTVMRMADPAIDLSPAAAPVLNRKCAACEDQEKQTVRREAEAADGEGEAAPSRVHDVLGSPGASLDPPTRDFMASRFGADFGDVRIHVDAAAAESARSVGAHAYTVGSHVVFGAGRYDPHGEGGRRLIAHELAHVVQQGGGEGRLRREPAPTGGGKAKKAPPPAPCIFDCLATTFQQMNEGDRDMALSTACPDGFPSATGTFFGQTIPSAAGKLLRAKLLQAQSQAKREFCVQGRDPETAFVLDRTITTYVGHSGGIDKSVDIDVQGQPYLMHEATANTDERAIDAEVAPVMDRIAYWAVYRKSVVPRGITSVARVPKGAPTDRTWRDPATGKADTATTTGELYDKLAEESRGMQDYFNLLNKKDSELGAAISAFNDFNTDGSVDLAKLGIPLAESDAAIKAFRQRIADDYLILGGSRAQLKAFAGGAVAASGKTPPSHTRDRPFGSGAVAGATDRSGAPDPTANRRPELGFISLPKEVVVALTAVGLRWGAIDFGGESGDVMHFDCNNLPGC